MYEKAHALALRVRRKSLIVGAVVEFHGCRVENNRYRTYTRGAVDAFVFNVVE